ncbi:MAG: hypothetical protein EHM77_01875 [Planctomycetaceae bacterium]|nr:MAG: hypothetical protein EHM77_01875 [Planctomycetaceae bacterium]
MAPETYRPGQRAFRPGGLPQARRDSDFPSPAAQREGQAPGTPDQPIGNGRNNRDYRLIPPNLLYPNSG